MTIYQCTVFRRAEPEQLGHVTVSAANPQHARLEAKAWAVETFGRRLAHYDVRVENEMRTATLLDRGT